VFKQATPEYQQALNVSGYKYNLEYQDIRMGATNSMKRKRKITWFNPPFSQNVQTNVAKCFLKIIDKCFPADHKLHKIINRNTIKVSYSCMMNLKSIISQHNKNIIQQHEENKTHPQRDSIAPTTDCNCRDKANCPVGGKCLEKNIIYQATVKATNTNKEETYIGLASTTFKERYRNHIASFKNTKNRNATTLSSHIWSLKDNSIQHKITWRIIEKAQPYRTETNKCNLCLREKFIIICKPQLASLNSKNELASECRHKKKFLLSSSAL